MFINDFLAFAKLTPDVREAGAGEEEPGPFGPITADDVTFSYPGFRTLLGRTAVVFQDFIRYALSARIVRAADTAGSCGRPNGPGQVTGQPSSSAYPETAPSSSYRVSPFSVMTSQ
jgi:hypothetical protein